MQQINEPTNSGKKAANHPIPFHATSRCPTVGSVGRFGDEPQYIDQPAIAQMLSIDRRTLRRLIVKGEFPPADLVLSKTLLRWKRDTVESWLTERVHGGGTQSMR
jgi:predicted DNA-binding transcriptional regulator AlpA